MRTNPLKQEVETESGRGQSATSSVRSAASSTAPSMEARSPSSLATTGVGHGVEHVAAQAHPDRLEQRLAGPGQVAADHDPPG